MWHVICARRGGSTEARFLSPGGPLSPLFSPFSCLPLFFVWQPMVVRSLQASGSDSSTRSGPHEIPRSASPPSPRCHRFLTGSRLSTSSFSCRFLSTVARPPKWAHLPLSIFFVRGKLPSSRSVENEILASKYIIKYFPSIYFYSIQ